MPDTNHKKLIRTAELAATGYVDTTDQWKTLSTALSDITDAVRANYKLGAGIAPTEAQEREFFAAHGHPKLTVGDLLNTAIRTNDIFVGRLFGGDAGATLTAGLLDICVASTNLAFLPPDEGEILKGDGTTAWEAPKFDYNRLPQVLSALSAMDIRLDELIIYQGQVQPNQMRQKPYDVIEVLTKGVQIAVCPQVGEALFVLPKPSTEFTTLDWARVGKDALEVEHGATRITMAGDWLTKLQDVVSGRACVQASTPETIKITKSNIRQNRITITEQNRIELYAEMQRTGMGNRVIHKAMVAAGVCPEGLTSAMISSFTRKYPNSDEWVVKTCAVSHAKAILNCLRVQPTAKIRINLDDKERSEDIQTWRERLFAEMQRTGHTYVGIHGGLVRDCELPKGLTRNKVETYCNPSTLTCPVIYIGAMLNWLNKQPTIKAEKRVNFDEKENERDTLTRRDKLFAERKRTGKGLIFVYRVLDSKGLCPEGFNELLVQSWLRKKKSGKWSTATCLETHFQAALQGYAQLPSKDAAPRNAPVL